MHTSPRYFRKILLAAAAGFLLLLTTGRAQYSPTRTAVPEVPREFRGAWVATVWNLDWPSKPGLSADRQKAELIRLLDRAQQLKLNALLLQVRPNSDALYASKIEPWSAWLTGTMGQPPAPYYDPLAFAVTEAHRRGIQLHAWFNPFRAIASASQPVSRDHVSKQHPDWLIRYDKGVWLDPANPEVRAHVTRVILDVVRRYNIDGVHLDDYFYPYPVKRGGGNLEFDDAKSFARFGQGGSRAEWRRQNINTFIENLYAAIKSARREVVFGISPFGIWRPRVPASIEAGVDAFDDLYADSRLWLQKGWLDYLAPQLYWSIRPAAQSFPVLLDWWVAQNTRARQVWPGIATERIGPKRPASEMIDQIQLIRRGQAGGEIHWSMKSLLQDQGGIAGLLRETVYAQPALVPAMPWLGPTPPVRPELEFRPVANGASFSWSAPGGGAEPRQWVVQQRFGTRWDTRILPADQRSLTVRENLPQVFAVTAVSATGITGPAAVLGQNQ